MRKIMDILRLKHEAKLSNEKIGRACGVSKGGFAGIRGRDLAFTPRRSLLLL